jgi:hypothetical protein
MKRSFRHIVRLLTKETVSASQLNIVHDDEEAETFMIELYDSLGCDAKVRSHVIAQSLSAWRSANDIINYE